MIIPFLHDSECMMADFSLKRLCDNTCSRSHEVRANFEMLVTDGRGEPLFPVRYAYETDSGFIG
jgi:hypothetical protein